MRLVHNQKHTLTRPKLKSITYFSIYKQVMSTQPAYRMSSGLVHLTKLHSQRSLSEGSLQSNGSTYTTYTCDDRSWSWKHLQNEFRAKDAETLFTKYQVRLQHNFFIVLLMLNICFNLAAIIIYFQDEVSIL